MSQIPQLSEAKWKEGIFDGPQIRLLLTLRPTPNSSQTFFVFNRYLNIFLIHLATRAPR